MTSIDQSEPPGAVMQTDHKVFKRSETSLPLISALSYLYHDLARCSRDYDAAELASSLARPIASRLHKCLAQAEHSGGEPGYRQSLVQQAKTLLEKQGGGGNISVQGLAADLGVSVRTLQRSFITAEGVSPKQWLIHSQLRHAQSLIESRSAEYQTVTQVAMEAGFNDFGRFAKLYRNRFNQTPSEAMRVLRAFKA